MSAIPARSGFTLLTVVWGAALASTIAGAAALTGRNGYESSRNRIASEQARWLALACANQTRSLIDSLLRSPTTRSVQHQLLTNPESVIQPAVERWESRCGVSLEPVGRQFDANAIEQRELRRAMVRLAPELSFDSAFAELASARPFRDSSQLLQLPLLSQSPRLVAILGVEAGPVSLRFASRDVLLALPGISQSGADAIERLRAVDSLPEQLLDLLPLLPKGASDTLLSRFPELSRSATIDPTAWIARFSASQGRPAITARLELRVSLARQMTIQRYRLTW